MASPESSISVIPSSSTCTPSPSPAPAGMAAATMTTTKRKRADSQSVGSRKAKKEDGEGKLVIPKPPYDCLGFDPFAPHPGMTKEERKLARMIRNRNAAQASRDRKKEHVVELENRVRELEAQLAAATSAPMPSFSTDFFPQSSTASHSQSRSPSPAPSQHSSAASTISPTQAASMSQARIQSLEEENNHLRDRLEEEARRSGELKGRLEGVEKRFEGLERLLGGLVGLAVNNQNGQAQAQAAHLAELDWSSLLAPTPTVANFPVPWSATISTELSAAEDTPMGPAVDLDLGSSNSTTSNRLVAREVSLQRTLVAALTAPSSLMNRPSPRPRQMKVVPLTAAASRKKACLSLTSQPWVSRRPVTTHLPSLGLVREMVGRGLRWRAVASSRRSGCGAMKVRVVLKRE